MKDVATKKIIPAYSKQSPTILILTRHGTTDFNKNGIIQGGRSNTKLSKDGVEQAKKLAKELLKYQIDVVYSSDLDRCKQTLAPYVNKSHKYVHYTKALREKDYGIFDGKPNALYDKWKTENNAQGNFELAPPKGESFNLDIMPRVSKILKSILKKQNGKAVLICSHNVINKALLLLLFKQTPKLHYDDYQTDNASLTLVEIKGNKPKIKLLNSTKHLR